MNVKWLIDDIVRQTTILIAQLSTAAGDRSPLSHVADQVFLELSRELEAQGVKRKVAADMFGLALRSYQLKVQRLGSTPLTQPSLWQTVHEKLLSGSHTRKELETILPAHKPEDVAAVLNDMVSSGLAYSTGRGFEAVFGLTSDADRKRVSASLSEDELVDQIWFMVATGDVSQRERLLERVSASPESIDAAIQVLLSDQRLNETGGVLSTSQLLIPVDAEQGWEVAVCDHYRAVATAIAAKLKDPRSRASDLVGGATLSFTVHEAHPFKSTVEGLLKRTRSDVDAIWQAVANYNTAHPPPESASKVTFYFGQNITREAGVNSDEPLETEHD
ncbi:MAG: hypothetical protein RJA70_260 [Pseudomonadota bacterium]|jgi:hypothetical protein